MVTATHSTPIDTGPKTTWESIKHSIQNSRVWKKGAEIANHVTTQAKDKAHAIWQKIEATSVYQNLSNFHKNNIKPLTELISKTFVKQDAYTMIGGIIIAASIFGVAFATFGPAIIPLSSVGSTMVLLKSSLNVHDRIRRTYNEMGWHRLDRMRKHTHEATPKNLKLPYLLHHLNKLKTEKEFKHLEKDITTFEKDVTKFRTDFPKEDYNSYKDNALLAVSSLKALAATSTEPGLIALRQKIDSFENNLKQAGKSAYVQGQAFQFMLDLERLKLADDQQELLDGIRNPLKHQMDLLDTALQRPSTKDVKQLFNHKIETLMKKLIPDWPIPTLEANAVAGPDDEETREVPPEPPVQDPATPQPTPPQAASAPTQPAPAMPSGLGINVNRIPPQPAAPQGLTIQVNQV